MTTFFIDKSKLICYDKFARKLVQKKDTFDCVQTYSFLGFHLNSTSVEFKHFYFRSKIITTNNRRKIMKCKECSLLLIIITSFLEFLQERKRPKCIRQAMLSKQK